MSCHGADLEGGEVFAIIPSLKNIKERLDRKAIINTISNGKGAMPSFAFLSAAQKNAIASFLLEVDNPEQLEVEQQAAWPYPYYFDGYKKFLDPDGYPAISPPWGTLNAVNLHTGEISWKVTLGEYPELAKQGITDTGCESYGGPVVTAAGLVFMAGTLDSKIRVFDKDIGKLLWEHELPYAGFATPSVYAIDGKQYVVIACGGGKLNQPSGDAYVAFAL